jgi:hypothetical protein
MLISGFLSGYWYIKKHPKYDPNAEAKTRMNKSFSEKYPVLRRKDFEEIVLHLKQSKGIYIKLPEWPSDIIEF